MRAYLAPVVMDRTPRYREAAYTAIKNAILSGQCPPGQPLVEEHIAQALKISRTPVREALAILEHEKLLVPRNGRGLYVRQLSREEFVQMFVASETVEPYLVQRAALLATDAQLAEIDKVIVQGESCASSRDLPGYLRAGRDFHRLVGLAADNLPLTEFISRNEEKTDLYLLSYGKVLDTSSMNASMREHRAILNAIAAREPEAAARLVVHHSQSLRERLAPLFNGADDRDS